MTSISTSSATARTDVPGPVPAAPHHMTHRAIRACGVVLAVGATAWSVSSFVWGFAPSTELGIKMNYLTGFAFQVGIMALLHVQLFTRATGVKAISRRLLKLERVLLAGAMVWSLADALLPSQRGSVWLGVLDVFWPLSMLGMFFIGIKVAVAGRWRGGARVWSLVAETWAPICVPLIGILGHARGDIVGALHLLVGYTVLGLILAGRPDLVEDRG